MAKLHNIGPHRFIQFMRLPVEWGNKFWVRGWTQEIEEPFRTAEPVLVRLPFYRAIAFGHWTGFAKNEEDALNRAIERRDVTYDDFVEEKGWTPPPEQVGEEDSLDSIDGTYHLG